MNENIKVNSDILYKLLYSNINNNLMYEIELINLYNSINYPNLNKVGINSLLRFKEYINFCNHIIIKAPALMKYCTFPPFYSIENIKIFLKFYYNIIEISKNDKLIMVKINNKIYNYES